MVNRDFRACARAYLFRLIFILADKADLVLSGVLHILFSGLYTFLSGYPGPQPVVKDCPEYPSGNAAGFAREDLARILRRINRLIFVLIT